MVAPLVPGYDFAADIGARGFVNKDQLQGELVAHVGKINELITRLGLIQRDDGNVADGAVRVFSLADEVRDLLGGWVPKLPAAWATTANVLLTGLGTQAGGEWTGTLTAGQRVLVRAQTNAAENGVYVAAAGAWARAPDLATPATIAKAHVIVEAGTTFQGVRFVCPEEDTIILGVSAITWTPVSSSIGIPVDGSISTAKIQNDAVTSVKIAAILATGTTLARRLEARFADIANVLDFSGVDPTGAADSTAGIQAAINTGKPVYFPKGDYKIVGDQLVTAANSQVLFSDGGATFTRNTDLGGVKPILRVSHDRCRVQGLRFVMSGATADDPLILDGKADVVVIDCYFGQQCRNLRVNKNSVRCRVLNCQFVATESGVTTGGDETGNVDGPVTDCLIAGCLFNGCTTEAIDVNWDTHRLGIRDCIMVDCGSATDYNEAIDIGGGTGGTNNCTDIVVSGCLIYYSVPLKIETNGIWVKIGSDRVTIAQCIFFCTQIPVREWEYAVKITSSSRVFVSECVCWNWGKGIVVDGSGNVIIANCLVEACYRDGIRLQGNPFGVDVINCNIRQFAAHVIAHGIQVSSGDAITIKSCRITARNGTACVRVENGLTGNLTVENCQLLDGTYGVFLNTGVKNVEVQNCRFEVNRGQSVDIAATCENIIIANNTFLNATVTGVAGDAGIYDRGGLNHVIVGNRFYDRRSGGSRTFRTAINISAAVTGGRLVDNHAWNLTAEHFIGMSNFAGRVCGNKADDATDLTGTLVYDPVSLVDGNGVRPDVTVNGAILGDRATASFSLAQQNIMLVANVEAANTVRVRFQNESAGTVDLASGTIFVRVERG